MNQWDVACIWSGFVTLRISSRKSLGNSSNPSQNGVTVTRSGADGRTHTCTSRKFHPYDQPGTWHHSWQAHSRESRLYLSTTCHGFEAASSKAKQSRMVSAASSGSMIGGNPFTILVAASFFSSVVLCTYFSVSSASYRSIRARSAMPTNPCLPAW